MTNLLQEQKLVEHITARMKDNTWTVATAINILTAIHLYKDDKSNFVDIDLIIRTQEQYAELIYAGVEFDKLHIIDENPAISTLSKIASGAVSGFAFRSLLNSGGGVLTVGAGITTSLGASVTAPTLLCCGLVAAALQFLPTKRKKDKFLRSMLLPSEVVEYSKSRGSWLDDQLFSENTRHTDINAKNSNFEISPAPPDQPHRPATDTLIESKCEESIKSPSEKAPACIDEKTLESKIRQEAGRKKGKSAQEIKTRIQDYAEKVLAEGCKCQHSELAEYLLHMKRGDETLAFQIPIYKNKPSIKSNCWPDHVLKATVKAFRNNNIPLRNEPKTEDRGRALCVLHRDWTPPSQTNQQ